MGHLIGNIPEFMPLGNSLNREILHSLRFHLVLGRFLPDGDETDEEEGSIFFSFSTSKEISRGIRHVWK